LLTQRENKILANSIVNHILTKKYQPKTTVISINRSPTMANAVPLDAPDLDKDEAVLQAKKIPSYQQWLWKNDGDFFTYAHR
jgi:hypothetical protein